LTEALLELLQIFNNDPKLVEIKETCSNDMLRYIRSFLPYSIEIQTKLISKYGYSKDNPGDNTYSAFFS